MELEQRSYGFFPRRQMMAEKKDAETFSSVAPPSRVECRRNEGRRSNAKMGSWQQAAFLPRAIIIIGQFGGSTLSGLLFHFHIGSITQTSQVPVSLQQNPKIGTSVLHNEAKSVNTQINLNNSSPKFSVRGSNPQLDEPLFR